MFLNQRLYLSETGISNKSILSIALYCTSLFSLSLVGCNVNSFGLLALGRKDKKCSETLQDLHLSMSLRYEQTFYGNEKFSTQEEHVSDLFRLTNTNTFVARVSPYPSNVDDQDEDPDISTMAVVSVNEEQSEQGTKP